MPDNYSAFLKHQLEYKIPGLLMRKTPGLPFAQGQFIPATGDLPIGLQYLTREVMEQFGEALIYSESSSDIPIVSTTVDEFGYRSVCFAAGVSWNQSELDHAQYANVDVVSRRTTFIPRVFDEAIQKFILAGSAKLGITGFFNNADIPATTPTYDITTATADNSLDLIYNIMSGVPERTNLTGGIAFLLVPEKLRMFWSRQILSGTSVSVIQNIMETYGVQYGGTLRGIVGINECKSSVLEAYGVQSAGTNKDLIMALPVSADAANRKFNARRAAPLEGPTKMTYSQYYMQDVSEVMIEFPKEFQYTKITKTA